MVIDTSALLCVYFAESHASWVADRLREHAPDLRMSTVNLTETFISYGEAARVVSDLMQSARPIDLPLTDPK